MRVSCRKAQGAWGGWVRFYLTRESSTGPRGPVGSALYLAVAAQSRPAEPGNQPRKPTVKLLGAGALRHLRTAVE
jgi:hypothetical protein